VTAPDQCCRNVKKFLPGRRPHVTRSGGSLRGSDTSEKRT
jgi:hypothetical protein